MRFHLACALVIAAAALGAAALVIPRPAPFPPDSIWLEARPPYSLDPHRTPGGALIDDLCFVGGCVHASTFWSATFETGSGRWVTYDQTQTSITLPSGHWTRYIRVYEDGGPHR
ncbi:MAG: hypothetical protein MUE73_14000 [Planctomycetes bacterium]|nr:hypothetical protein [Planctomycetota bacterium]